MAGLMDIGRMNIKAEVYYNAVVQSDTGAETITKTQLTTIWVSQEQISGREYITASTEKAEINKIYKSWYLKSIRPSMSLRISNSDYDIVAILPDKESRFMLLMCKEVS